MNAIVDSAEKKPAKVVRSSYHAEQQLHGGVAGFKPC
jgi:hypothetical protein